jgi:hypothetical protein
METLDKIRVMVMVFKATFTNIFVYGIITIFIITIFICDRDVTRDVGDT